MDLDEIKETLKDANIYLKSLEKLNVKIDLAKEQIDTTAQQTENHIKSTFTTLLNDITTILITRRDHLIRKTHKIKESSLLPLEDCKCVLNRKITKTNEFINNGNKLLNTPYDSIKSSEFLNKSSLLGTLPEVPQIKDVPYITFKFETKIEKTIVTNCRNFGSVIHTPPVQISTFTEKRGGILVEWQPIELDEQLGDIQEYKVQKALGDVNLEQHLQFRDCYNGLDNQHLVRNLKEYQPYTFRVCCKFEGETEWSPWSLPIVTCTTLKPFKWETNPKFNFTNDNHIATPKENEISMVFTQAVDFTKGDSVQFTFIEVDEDLNYNYIGLFPSDQIDKIDNAILVTTTGAIFNHGQEKMTQFLPARKGWKVCFTCDSKINNKLRINIDTEGGRVTYDWIVNQQICFAAKLNSSKWQILIE